MLEKHLNKMKAEEKKYMKWENIYVDIFQLGKLGKELKQTKTEKKVTKDI